MGESTTPPAGTPERERKRESVRPPHGTPRKHTLGRSLVAWLGTLTLSGGDLDGQKFTVWPWERRFIIGNLRTVGKRCPEHRAW